MEIHIARDGQQFGPFPPEEVRRQLAAGALLPTDFAWSEGAVGWVQISTLPSLMSPPQTPGFPSVSLGAAPAVAPVYYRAVPTSGAAIASMVLGILSLTAFPVVPALAGIICGHIARGNIRRSGGMLAGDGMAVAGLVTSYIGLSLLVLVMVFVFAMIFAGLALPFLGATQTQAKVTKSLDQASQIGTACRLYAADHQDKFPKTLEELVPKYLPDRSLFTCPLSEPFVPMGYRYFGGTAKDPDEKILLMSKYQDPNGQRVVVRVNGSAAFEKPPPQLLPPGGR